MLLMTSSIKNMNKIWLHLPQQVEKSPSVNFSADTINKQNVSSVCAVLLDILPSL